MEYAKFINDVTSCLQNRVEVEYEVKVNRVMKNNSVVKEGVVFFSENETISPNIYLDSYFERYQRGESLDMIAEDILQVYEANMVCQDFEKYHFNFAFQEMEEKIIYTLVNYKKNQQLLSQLPHVRFLDLAIIFCCLVRKDEEGIGTVRITNEHMMVWEKTIHELMRLAIINTPRIFPAEIAKMDDVILKILKSDVYQMMTAKERRKVEKIVADNEKKKSIDEIVEEAVGEFVRQQENLELYILTNSTGVNGASALLYKDVLKEFATKCNCDFYILPSSIHEIILVPYKEKIEKDKLQLMVEEVNQTQVPCEEILSNQVYIYHRENNMIER